MIETIMWVPLLSGQCQFVKLALPLNACERAFHGITFSIHVRIAQCPGAYSLGASPLGYLGCANNLKPQVNRPTLPNLKPGD